MGWEIHIKHGGAVNFAKLHEEMAASISGVSALSVGDYGVRVHMMRRPTSADSAKAAEVVKLHNPAQLTPEQQALEQWKADVAALSAKDWSTLTPAEREKALRLQHEQMIYQATGKLPPSVVLK